MSETIPSTTPTAISLSNRTLIAVTGKDAAHFLHNLLTANIEALKPGEGTLAALLTPQGKIAFEMLIYNASDEEPLFLLDVLAGFAEPLHEKLVLYKLRAEVGFTLLGQDVGTMVLFDAPATTGDAFYTFADPRHAMLGQRLYGPVEALEAASAGMLKGDASTYHARRMALGVPESGMDYVLLDVFPHDVLLDQLGGIDFKKGCYIGQEVVSRMEHRGSARTRALPVKLLNGFGSLGGAEVNAGERLLGRIGESVGDRAIALLRLDRLEDALKAEEEITAGGVPIAIETPDFVRFKVPSKV